MENATEQLDPKQIITALEAFRAAQAAVVEQLQKLSAAMKAMSDYLHALDTKVEILSQRLSKLGG